VIRPGSPPLRLEVRVSAAPHPGLLRIAIAHRLAGRAFPSAPEDQVARAVARAVDEARSGGAR
jgi:hypothetical protein